MLNHTDAVSHCRPPVIAAPNKDSPPRPAPHVRYRPPTVEDAPENGDDAISVDSAVDMTFEQTLTPGADHYRTYRKSCLSTPESRARMIPNQRRVRFAPAPIVGGCRRKGKPLPKPELPALSVPLPQLTPPQPPSVERPELDDIRLLGATSFLQFCRDPAPTPYIIPDLPDNVFRDILQGQGDWEASRRLFQDNMHDFLDECFLPLRLSRITEADISKFLEGKPDVTDDDVRKSLPDWLQDLYDAFLPRLANELPPRRAWDHKIELMPGKEPPYQKNRPFSPPELRVVRK
ncbi:hypothetical protein V8F06_014941, partial [Rhypophila decipiens]